MVQLETEMLIEDPVLRVILEHGERFHGHLGPFLVVGVRMARLATALLGELGHIHSETGLEPPISCITDGLQIATAHTLCNNGISFSEDGVPAATFKDNRKQVLRIELRPTILERIKDVTREDMLHSAETIARLPASDLFIWIESPE